MGEAWYVPDTELSIWPFCLVAGNDIFASGNREAFLRLEMDLSNPDCVRFGFGDLRGTNDRRIIHKCLTIDCS